VVDGSTGCSQPTRGHLTGAGACGVSRANGREPRPSSRRSLGRSGRFWCVREAPHDASQAQERRLRMLHVQCRTRFNYSGCCWSPRPVRGASGGVERNGAALRDTIVQEHAATGAARGLAAVELACVARVQSQFTKHGSQDVSDPRDGVRDPYAFQTRGRSRPVCGPESKSRAAQSAARRCAGTAAASPRKCRHA